MLVSHIKYLILTLSISSHLIRFANIYTNQTLGFEILSILAKLRRISQHATSK